MFKFPGEKLQVQGPKLMPGYGIKAIAGHLVASQAGMLENSKSHISIANNRKRYIPNIGDFVVGIIISKHSENYRVDIGGPLLASTDLLAFENASKRNRPNLAVGAVIYARLVSNDADFEPELECMNADGKSDVFGELSNGTVVTCSLRMASRYIQN